MKFLFTLTSIAALSTIAYAGPDCDGEVCDKSAALSAEGKCPDIAECSEKECSPISVTSTQFVVTGMTCGGCTGEVTKSLAAIEGISDVAADHETGTATMHIDSHVSSKTAAVAAITDLGYKVAGERVSFPLGAACATGCPVKLNETFASAEGVVSVESMDEASGTITLIIDPTVTSHETLAAIANPPAKKG